MADSRHSVDLERRLRDVRLLVLDVDGVLTDGGLYYTEHGDEMKRFCVHDGFGIEAAQREGVKVAFISGSSSASVEHRARRLGVQHVHLGVKDKLGVLTSLTRELGVELSEVAYVGDDMPDAPALECVGVPLAVANAVVEIRSRAVYVTSASGGNGAVREICDVLVRSRQGREN